jgi:hypothetical protein
MFYVMILVHKELQYMLCVISHNGVMVVVMCDRQW